MPWLTLSYVITPGSSPAAAAKLRAARRDARGVLYDRRTLAMLTIAVLGVWLVGSYLGSATVLQTALTVPLAAASLAPAAVLAVYLRGFETRSYPVLSLSMGGFLVLTAYLAGVGATFVAGALGAGYPGWLAAAVGVEEAVKLAAALALIYLARVQTPVQAAGVGAAVGLGFAGAENLVYLLNTHEALLMSVERAAIAPVHVLVSAAAAATYVSLREHVHLIAAGVAGFTLAFSLHLVYNVGAVGELHPVIVDGVGYVVFASAFFLVSLTVTEMIRRRPR